MIVVLCRRETELPCSLNKASVDPMDALELGCGHFELFSSGKQVSDPSLDVDCALGVT